MTKNEMAFVVAFLKDLSDGYGNDTCNDLTLENTSANRKMVVEAEGNDFELPDDDEDFGVCNWSIVDHLVGKLMKEYKLKDKDLPDVGG